MKQNNQKIPKAIKRGQLLIDEPNDVRLIIAPTLDNTLPGETPRPELFKCYFKFKKNEEVTEFFCYPGENAIVVE